MKLTQHVYITDPAGFAKGDFEWCFQLVGKKLTHSSWIYAGEIEIEVDIDRQTAVLAAKAEIDKAELELRAKFTEDLTRIETRRAELLALPHLEVVNND